MTDLICVPEWALLGDDVARAAGLVSAQAGCSADRALGLLRERAERCGRSLHEIAIAAIERELRFDGSPPLPFGEQAVNSGPTG